MLKIFMKRFTGLLTAFALILTSLLILPQNVKAEDNFLTRDPFYNFSSQYHYFTSDHFQFIWGNGGESSKVTQEFLQQNAKNLEDCYSEFIKDLGMEPPSKSVDMSKRDDKNYKLNVYISTTGLEGMQDDWAYMSYDADKFPYLFACPDAMKYNPPSWVLPHEFGHAVTAAQLGWNDNKYSQAWWEALGNWFREQYLYSDYSHDETGHGTDFFETYLKNMCLTFPCGRDYYAAWPFFQYLTENPDNMDGYGRTFVKDMLQKGRPDEYPLDIVDRLAPADIKDTLGNFAKRMATLDFLKKDAYNARLNELLSAGDWNYNEIYTYLEKYGDVYYVPTERAPQAAGINVIPLKKTSNRVTVKLNGLSNIKGADWRACIAAEGADGRTYYSKLFKSGETQSLDVAAASKVYLTVAATPDNDTYKKVGLPYGHDSEFAEKNIPFTSKERYPYSVNIAGAEMNYFEVPSNVPGHRHENGGGFVADTANVSPTAYVGPNAKVLGFANVSDNAKILNNAVVEGNSTVSGNAVIKDRAMVCENGTVTGNAFVADTAQVMGSAVIKDNAKVIESALVYGDYKLSGNAVAKGMAFCMAKGSLSDQAVVDGDWYDDASKTAQKGTSFGWVCPQEYVDARPYTDGGAYEYNFDSDGSKTFDDKYNSTFGICVNNPRWEAKRTGAEGVLTFNGKNNYAVLDRSISGTLGTTFEIECNALYRGGNNNQTIFIIDGLKLTAENENGLPEVEYNGQTFEAKEELVKGTWNDFDIEVENSTLNLIINGKKILSEKIDKSIQSSEEIKNNYLARDERGNYFNGSIDNFSVYFKNIDLKYKPIADKEEISVPSMPPIVDLNVDGKFDVIDVKILQDYCLGRVAAIPRGGDVNKDGKINVKDVTLLKQILNKQPMKIRLVVPAKRK